MHANSFNFNVHQLLSNVESVWNVFELTCTSLPSQEVNTKTAANFTFVFNSVSEAAAFNHPAIVSVSLVTH